MRAPVGVRVGVRVWVRLSVRVEQALCASSAEASGATPSSACGPKAAARLAGRGPCGMAARHTHCVLEKLVSHWSTSLRGGKLRGGKRLLHCVVARRGHRRLGPRLAAAPPTEAPEGVGGG